SLLLRDDSFDPRDRTKQLALAQAACERRVGGPGLGREARVGGLGGRQDAIKRCRRIEAVARGEPKAKVTPKTFARDLVSPRAAQESGETANVLEARARRPRVRRKRRAESAARPPQEEEHRCAGQQHCATEPCPLEHGHERGSWGRAGVVFG